MISGRVFAVLAASSLVAACASAPRTRPTTDADLAITNVGVIDVERGQVLTNHAVLIRGPRIVAVAPARGISIPTGTRVIDATGKFLIPGLWDMHAHVGLSANPVRLELPLFVAHGVTGIRIMGTQRTANGLDRVRQLQTQINDGTVTGPRFLAVATWAVNGPAGIGDSLPAFFKARTQDEGRQLAQYFKEKGYDFIKIYNQVPREGYLGLTEEARRLNLPFAGHEPESLSAIEISNAGQRSIEHSRIFLLNCFAAADSVRNAPGTVRRRRMVDEYDPKICAEVFRTFVRNDTYITPTHVTRRMDAFADDSAYRHDARMKYIPSRQQMGWLLDANGMVAQDTSVAGRRSFMDFYTKGLELTNAAYRAGVPVMLGTDAGDSFVFPGASVHDELGELVKAGLSPAEALRAATVSGARFLGRTEDFGTVKAGHVADLVLLDANPLDDIRNSRRIRAVVRNGGYLDRPVLDSMLASVEAAGRPLPQFTLWIGAITGDTVAIGSALAAGAQIDALDTSSGASGRRALNWAALNNKSAAIRVLLARGAKINLANGTGFTPVHHAAEAGALDAIRTLIAAGADVTIPNAGGVTPVETARRRGDQAAVSLLEGATKKP